LQFGFRPTPAALLLPGEALGDQFRRRVTVAFPATSMA
jgi:hypothetical protein